MLLAANCTVQAQAPQGFNFQGIALDSTGYVVASKSVSLRFSITTDSLGSAVSYQESVSAQTDKYGQFTTVIGSGNPSIGDFKSIPWATGNLFIKTEIDIEGAGTYITVGLSKLLSVPYALQANSASSIISDSLHNTRAGSNSLYKNTTGKINTATGDSSLYSNTTGSSNTANGNSSLYSNTTGSSNTANGKGSLYNNTTGSWNTANGMHSLYQNTTGYYNTSSGMQSLYSNTTGYSNTAYGVSSLQQNTTGYLNIATGQGALGFNTTGNRNLANGTNSLWSNSTGSFNSASGMQSLYSNTTGSNNTAIGYNAGGKLETGDKNIFIGNDAGNNINFTTTSNKLVIQNDSSKTPLIYGEFDNKKLAINGDLEVTGALKGSFSRVIKNGINTSDTMFLANDVDFYETGDGFWNPVVNLPLPNSSNSYLIKRLNTSLLLNCRSTLSFKILKANTDLEDELTLHTGEYAIFTYAFNRWILTGKTGGLSDISSDTLGNTRVGAHSLEKNTTGSNNTSTGFNSLYSNTTGSNNTANGESALYSNTTGYANTAIGDSSLFSNTTGKYNTGNGYRALLKNTTGSSNTASGWNSLYSNTTGQQNTAYGQYSLLENTTGSFNTAIGAGSVGDNTTGIFNTAIGISSLKKNTTGSYNTATGYGSLLYNTTGKNNTAYGYLSGYQNTTGNYNVFLGHNSGNNSIFATVNNKLIIDNHGSATPLIYGDFANKTIRFNAHIDSLSILNRITFQDENANDHIAKYDTGFGSPLIYERYFYGHYGDLVLQGMSKGYTGNIHFVTGSNMAGYSPPTQRMVIMDKGNVGIGNFVSAPPKAKLEVQNGDVYISDSTKGMILTSPDGRCWRVTIDNTGNFVRTAISCPAY